MKNKRIEITEDIIETIQEELDYTSRLTEIGRADTVDYGVEGQLITLSTYTRKAIDAWTNNPSNELALHELRKVAAIAIRALIVGGCPKRN